MGMDRYGLGVVLDDGVGVRVGVVRIRICRIIGDLQDWDDAVHGWVDCRVTWVCPALWIAA